MKENRKDIYFFGLLLVSTLSSFFFLLDESIQLSGYQCSKKYFSYHKQRSLSFEAVAVKSGLSF